MSFFGLCLFAKLKLVKCFPQVVLCVLGWKSAGMWACSRLVLPTRQLNPEGAQGGAGSGVCMEPAAQAFLHSWSPAGLAHQCAQALGLGRWVWVGKNHKDIASRS